MNNNLIVHISEVNIALNGGMGRVEWNWKQEFERRGYNFFHIGPKEVGKVKHPALFPYKAYKYFKKLALKPLLIIVHEPAGGLFVNKGFPVFIESHGVEQRHWELSLQGKIGEGNINLKTKLLFPWWRLYNCNKGLKNADFLMLINQEDKVFVQNKFTIPEEKIFVFKNGIFPITTTRKSNPIPRIVFNASWIERKGIRLLVEAAKALQQKGISAQYLLMGTGKSENEVLKDWPSSLFPNIEILPKFDSKEEQSHLAKGDLFVLPSYYEGQPLSLLQAMATGLCCISSNCCGQKDLIINGVNGYLFESGNLQDLVSKIENCISTPVLIDTIGANAIDAMRKRIWEITNKETVDYILNAAEKK